MELEFKNLKKIKINEYKCVGGEQNTATTSSTFTYKIQPIKTFKRLHRKWKKKNYKQLKLWIAINRLIMQIVQDNILDICRENGFNHLLFYFINRYKSRISILKMYHSFCTDYTILDVFEISRVNAKNVHAFNVL